jgi:hypothetical protein
MSKRLAFIVSIVCACTIALVISLALQVSGQRRFELLTISPDTTYQVDCKEEVGTHAAGHHEVRFKVLKEKRPIIENELLYEGGFYDNRFSELFPDHSWVSSSVLRFGRKDSVPLSQHDEVIVANETDQSLTYLRLNAGKYEAFLLFEVKPKSSLTLNVQPQSDEGRDSSYIGCKGRFDDGNLIAEAAGNFGVRGRYRGRSHYSVKITNKGVLISSQEFAALP